MKHVLHFVAVVVAIVVDSSFVAFAVVTVVAFALGSVVGFAAVAHPIGAVDCLVIEHPAYSCRTDHKLYK